MVLGDRKTIREVFENIELSRENDSAPVYVHNR